MELLIGIIPIPHLKQGFHHHSRHIFQRCRSDTSCKISQYQIMLERHGYDQHHDRPASVQREKRPPHKPTVYRMPVLQRHIGRFKAPSKKAVKIKEKQPLCHGIRIHIFPPSSSASPVYARRHAPLSFFRLMSRPVVHKSSKSPDGNNIPALHRITVVLIQSAVYIYLFSPEKFQALIPG